MCREIETEAPASVSNPFGVLFAQSLAQVREAALDPDLAEEVRAFHIETLFLAATEAYGALAAAGRPSASPADSLSGLDLYISSQAFLRERFDFQAGVRYAHRVLSSQH